MNLYVFKDFYKPKSLKPFFAILDELEYIFRNDYEAFYIVREYIEKDMYSYVTQWKDYLLETGNPRLHIMIAINDISFSCIGSGKYHRFRGDLSDSNEGIGLMNLFKYSSVKLVEMKHWSKKDAVIAMKEINKAIALVG